MDLVPRLGLSPIWGTDRPSNQFTSAIAPYHRILCSNPGLPLHIDNDHTMSSTNFAAAQERVLERRRLREAESRARLAEQQRASPVNHPALQRLPYPLNTLPQTGFSLWNAIRGREGIRPAFRVGQVDAELLDEELLGLLKNQVGDALKYYRVGSLLC